MGNITDNGTEKRLSSRSTFRHVDQMGDLHQPENIALAHDKVVKSLITGPDCFPSSAP